MISSNLLSGIDLKSTDPQTINSVLSDTFLGTMCTTRKEVSRMEFQIRYVYGHYQVYSSSGMFLFSADTEAEAMEDLKDLA